jgi:hypothetical protein
MLRKCVHLLHFCREGEHGSRSHSLHAWPTVPSPSLEEHTSYFLALCACFSLLRALVAAASASPTPSRAGCVKHCKASS